MNRIIITILVIGTLFFLLTVIETYGIPMIISNQIVGVHIGGGSIDMDPDLSPSYALDFAWNPLFYPLFAIIGIIASSFLVTYFIVKWKKKPIRPYLALLLAGVLLFSSVPILISSPTNLYQIFTYAIEKNDVQLIVALLIAFLPPTIELIIAGVLLYRSSLIRKLIKKRK